MLTISTRWFLDRAHVKKQLGKGNVKALTRAGVMVRNSVLSTIRRDTPQRVGSNRTVGTYRGLPLIERRTRRSRRGEVVSWNSRRGRYFLRNAISYAWDPSSSSVVIGPRKMQSAYSSTLFQLQERGGTQTQRLYLRFRGRPVPRQVAFGLRRTGGRSNLSYVGSFMSPRPSTRNFVAAAMSRTARVPAGRYQGRGLSKVINKIPDNYRDRISGP